MHYTFTSALSGLALCASITNAIDLNLDSKQSILDASKIVANNLITEYNATAAVPGGIPGLLPQPYYWWNAGYMFNGLIKYWALSGDDSVVPTITQALLFQVGPDDNYLPPNQTKSLGNDDQAAWALAAMSAAEYGLPDPSSNITWVELADAVFQGQVARWNEASCGGGLKWQIFSFNNGYNYKNAITQGSFAQLAARLDRFTGNSTYSEWATRAVEWTRNVGLLSNAGQVYDGTDDSTNCSEINHIQWTLDSGLFLSAGAYAANATASESATGKYWTELNQLVSDAALKTFVKNGTDIAYEVACEPSGNCNVDQIGFRAGFVRSLATLRDMAPAGNDDAINKVLRASAAAAAASCTGGDGTACAVSWVDPDTKGLTVASNQINENLNALEVFLAILPIGDIKTGVVNANGTSTGSSATGGAVASSGNGDESATTSQPPAFTGSSTRAASNLMVTVAGLFAALLALA